MLNNRNSLYLESKPLYWNGPFVVFIAVVISNQNISSKMIKYDIRYWW